MSHYNAQSLLPSAPVPRPTSPDTDGVAHDGWFYSDHIVFLVGEL